MKNYLCNVETLSASICNTQVRRHDSSRSQSNNPNIRKNVVCKKWCIKLTEFTELTTLSSQISATDITSMDRIDLRELNHTLY
jgi:hypothetical protein